MLQETREVRVGDQGTRVLDVGAGQPVVVLHGWGGRIESMAPVIDCLRRGHRVVAVDLPGFGESPAPAGVWGTPDYAEYVRDLLRDLDVERAHFVGHSFGAKTSFYLAATHPDVVEKLVLVGSPGLRTPPSMKARAKRGVSRAGKAAGRLGPPGRWVKQRLYERLASQDYRDAGPMRSILVKVVNEDLGHVLPRIKSSTLLVWGTEDDAAPVKHAHIMERLIPDAGLVLFDGAGHFAYLDQADRFCTIVRHFFGATR